jgi:hypothetical protein
MSVRVVSARADTRRRPRRPKVSDVFWKTAAS